MIRREEIVAKLNELKELKYELRDIAKEVNFEPSNCPLNDSKTGHYTGSQLLVGLGCWAWDCPFCDKHFEG